MPPMVCSIWVTWISNFFLRDLSTLIGGGGRICLNTRRDPRHTRNPEQIREAMERTGMHIANIEQHVARH